jgi:predicted RNase H-like HicB family nuclease
MEAKYEMIIYWSLEDKAFIVEVPELPGCMADGRSYSEAVANAEINIKEWIETVKELGNLDGGSIAIKDAPDGTYTISLKSTFNGDSNVAISFQNDSSMVYKSYHIFNHGDTLTFKFTLDSNSTSKLTINHSPLPPFNLQADLVDSGGLKTSLSWNVNTDPGVTGYNIYSKYLDEPYLSQIGTTSVTSYDTGHDWAADGSVKPRIYAVAVVKADGKESFLSDMVENNDRDHDGLTDAEETALGTNVSNPDTDGDGLLDGEEYYLGTDQKLIDTDGDGYDDYREVQAGSDPLDPNSIPRYFLYLPIIFR